jgi:hypothetical protein
MNLKNKKVGRDKYLNFGRGGGENKENDMNVGNRTRGKSSNRQQRRRSRSKSGMKRSRSNRSKSAKNRFAKPAGSVSTKIMPISRKAFKRVLALRNSKVIAVS